MPISKKEFSRRRKNLMQQMGENSIAILPAAPVCTRNRDVDFPYRQDSDFYYLSGFNEPESVMVLIPNRDHGEFVMFCRERDKTMELWHGYRSGQEGACKDFGADDAFPIDDIDDILPGLIEGSERVYYDMGKDSEFDRMVMDWVNTIKNNVRNGAHPPGEFLALNHLLHDLRLYKSAEEIRTMKQAASISAEGHIKAMQACRPGVTEYQLEGVLTGHFMENGCRFHAYPSIVGGGVNGCILHYVENSEKLKSGDLVLIDAGAENDNYAADITRTFPVNGKFSKEQRALYEVVLASQLAAIEKVKPGNHWDEPHDAAVKILTAGLVELGLLTGELNALIESEAYKPFYMHKTGHWLGMDVHDVGDYRVGDQWRVLEPGMTLTVEPGLYIAPDNKDVDEKWRGIGIRIEDDVVVTKDGNEVLSCAAPKMVEAIEELMAASNV